MSPLTGCQVTSRPRNRFSRYSKWLDTFWTAPRIWVVRCQTVNKEPMNKEGWKTWAAECYGQPVAALVSLLTECGHRNILQPTRAQITAIFSYKNWTHKHKITKFLPVDYISFLNKQKEKKYSLQNFHTRTHTHTHTHTHTRICAQNFSVKCNVPRWNEYFHQWTPLFLCSILRRNATDQNSEILDNFHRQHIQL